MVIPTNHTKRRSFSLNRILTSILFAGLVVIFLQRLKHKESQSLQTSFTLFAKEDQENEVIPISSGKKDIPINDCLQHINQVRGIRLYSQNDEDGAILQTLHCMGGHGTKEYFEFGSEDGSEVNTRVLRDLYGWHGHLLDGSNEDNTIPLHKEFFTPSNIVSLMKKYNVSKELDVLSIDCDMDDFYVTREILLSGFRPRVLINEYNVNFGPEWEVTTLPKPVGEESDPKHFWKGDCYFGVSARAVISLVRAFGYAPVFANRVNVIFVRMDKAEELGLSLPSPDIFPGPLPFALHRDCHKRTWKKVDTNAIKKATDESVSHVDFAKSMGDIILDHKKYRNVRHPSGTAESWRIFKDVTKEYDK
ncbi:hypothetical protein CTEN210_14843 [Chaetoceros tenuissimus]|uniref:Uncharacterized protein n=1 Tax=Chaetoceros tenuissimus TaxID=426638 RepID=A0AAD3HC43_9STRA|nr:hypothetical protein CTEN210_14843 [Chaetoceros tenuissimus]